MKLGTHVLSAKDAAYKLLNDRKHCDVIFSVGPAKEIISCHSLILRNRSFIFDEVCSQKQGQSARSNDIFQMNVEDASSKVFKSFIEFVYTDEWTAQLSPDEIVDLLEVGVAYKVDLLKEKCEEILKTKVKLSNAICWYQSVAVRYGLIELETVAADYIARSFGSLVKHYTFGMFEESALVYFLARDDLAITELKLFQEMIRWANHHLKLQREPNPISGQAQRKLLSKIIPLIRFPLMNLREFTKNVVPTKILSPEETVALFMYFNDDSPKRERCLDEYSFSFKPRRTVLRAPVKCEGTNAAV